MSRVGKNPIIIPEGVRVKLEGQEVIVEGPKGRLNRLIPSGINLRVSDGRIFVERSQETRFVKALHGLTRSLVNNMVIGVTQGFSKALEINGVGYRATLSGNRLIMHLGYSHPINFEPPEGIKIELTDPVHIKVWGIDKELVGRVAARIRSFRPPNPYNAKGISYQGEYIRRKAGKTA